MLPENLRQYAVASAVEAFDADAVTGGTFALDELSLEIAASKIASVCGFLKYDQKFIRLSSVTAVDRYPLEPRFEVVYHLHSLETRQRLRLKSRLSSGSSTIPSVTSVWRAANWYEREVFDLFGITFTGHPNLKRILMPDDWDGYPLRKDYNILGKRI